MTRNARDMLDAIARWLAAATVIGSLWLFAGAAPWAFLMMCLLADIALLTWFLRAIRYHCPDALRGTAGLLLIALLLVLQALPLPVSVLRLLSPLSAGITENRFDVFVQTGVTRFLSGHRIHLGSLSLSPHAGWRALYLFVAYAGVFLIFRSTVRTWDQLRRVVTAIVVSGFIMSVTALVHHFLQSENIYWFHVPRHGGAVFGPFTNRNHFAAYANMLVGAGLGLLLAARVHLSASATDAWRDWLRRAASPVGTGTALAAFAVVLFGTSVCLTLSRGGMVSLFAAAFLFGTVVFMQRRRSPNVLVLYVCLIAGVVGLVYWLGDDPVVRRLSTLGDVTQNPGANLRAVVTRDALKVFASFPVFGCGFGAFRHVFSMFQSPSLEYRWLHAHNDWVQLLAEGGIVGTFFFLLAAGQWAAEIYRHFPTAARRAGFVAVGLLFGIFTIALHSVVDYSLHKPANALLLAALAGLTTAAVRIKRQAPRDGDQPFVAEASPGARARILNLMGLAALTILLVAMVAELRQELAFARFLYLREFAARVSHPQDFRRVVDLASREAVRISRGGMCNPDAAVEVCHTLLAWSTDERVTPDVQTRLAEFAHEGSARAAAGAPSDYLTWLCLARTQAALGEWDAAEIFLSMARRVTGRGQKIRLFEPVSETVPLRQVP